MNVFDMPYYVDGRYREDLARLRDRVADVEGRTGRRAIHSRRMLENLEAWAAAYEARRDGKQYRVPKRYPPLGR